MGQEGQDAGEVQDGITGPPYAQLERTADNLRVDSDSICPRVFEVLVDRILQVEPQQSHRSLFTLIGASGGLARLGLEPYRQIKIHAVSLHAALLCHLPTFHIYGCESKIGYGSLRGDPYYGSRMLT